MSNVLDVVNLRVQKSVCKLLEMSTTTRFQTAQSGSRRVGSLKLTQADLYNYLYEQNDVTPLSQEDIRKERTPVETYWCAVCNRETPSLCAQHGSQHCKLSEKDTLSAAIKSFPAEVQLCQSSIPGTRFGVVTKCFIPKGTWLGPYEGTEVRPESVRLGTEASFMWEIYQGGRLAYYLDGSNEETSSWMRFIACARNNSEQNLYAFQYCGNIYYRAFKEIPPGTELLVWYDDIYPQFMGIPLEIRETEGIYQRAADPSKKNDEVVVVVSSAQENLGTYQTTQPPPLNEGSAIPYTSLPTSMATEGATESNNNSARHSTLPDIASVSDARSKQQTARRLSDPKTSQLLSRRQKSLPSHTSTGLWSRQSLDEQPGYQMTPDGNHQVRSEQADLDVSSSAQTRTRPEHGEKARSTTETRAVSPNPKESNAFKCGQCGKTFPQRSVLQIHVCPKQPYKPYHCGYCNRLFDDPNELRNHAMIHTNEKPFKCGYCSRSFSGATTLNNHIRTHTGEKPFECRVCGKTFSQASQLSRHEKIPGDCIE